MASSQAAATLSRAEQQAETKLGLLYAALAVKLWQSYVKVDDIDGSGYERFLELLIPNVLKARTQAASNGRKYYQTFRILETGDRTVYTPPKELITLDRSIVETSVRVTGPVAFKQRVAATKQLDLKPEVEKALLQKFYKQSAEGVAGAMMRHVVDGARQQVQEDVKTDQVALGYMRVMKSIDPCYYCAMLASRGPVYKQDSFDSSDARFTGGGNAKVHDHCACGMEPVFRRDTEWTPGARDAAEVWGNATKGKGGRGAINAFRAAWESR